MTSPGSQPAVRRLDFLPWEYAARRVAEPNVSGKRSGSVSWTGKVELADDVYVARNGGGVLRRTADGGAVVHRRAHAYVTGSVSARLGLDDQPVHRGPRQGHPRRRRPDRRPRLAARLQPRQRRPRPARSSASRTPRSASPSATTSGSARTRSSSTASPSAPTASSAPARWSPKTSPTWSSWSATRPASSATAAPPATRNRSLTTPAPSLTSRRSTSPSGWPPSPAARPRPGAATFWPGVLRRRPASSTAPASPASLDPPLVRRHRNLRPAGPPCAGRPPTDADRRLRSRQDPARVWARTARQAASSAERPPRPASYHILCAGYALQLLGSSFEHPIDVDLTDLPAKLDALPWARNAWSSGAAIDALGTAIARNLNDHKEFPSDTLFTLIGWLTARADPATGMWGQPHPDDGWLQVVNGFYRLTRGTYAQFGLPLPYPEQPIRTVLAHSQDQRGLHRRRLQRLQRARRHPPPLAGRPSRPTYGRAEGRALGRARCSTAILDRWVDGAGFAFAPDGTDDRAIPGLQGTEMWLAIIWLLTDYLGLLRRPSATAPRCTPPRAPHPVTAELAEPSI